MKSRLFFACMILFTLSCMEAESQDYYINTLLGNKSTRSSGGYGAITNKFTTINGSPANLVEMYGGWYVNHKFLLGVAFAGATNDLPVSSEFTALPGIDMSYEYGQVGLMTEYVIGSGKAIHIAFQLFTGTGFTVQYLRHSMENDYWDYHYDQVYDENWFFITEPGVKLEMNVFRWMRFSPGVSYRAAYNSNTRGLTDNVISGTSYNLTLKFGKF
jgi:hypothetical protein